MKRRVAAWLLAACALVAYPRDSAAISDPKLLYRTIETPHFRVTFYSGSEPVARHTADVAEAMFTEMSESLGWTPSERTEIFLTDITDSANGSATALPYNAIRLFITAPDDMSPLGDVDDWYLELVTHEYTHVLHTDHIRGVAAIANAVMGKTFAPNQVQPRWLLEGLAVYQESKHTSAGRMRSSIWDMFMRTDVLENNIATLDQMSNTARRWPQGNIWYLYGSYFLSFIADTYGDEALKAMVKDYGSHIIPWAINRSVRRATGRTFEELYPAWVDWMKRSYGAQRDRVVKKGIREGVRLTWHGQTAGHPRFSRDKGGLGAPADVVYYADDGRNRTGFYGLGLQRDAQGRIVGSRPQVRSLLVRTNGDSYGGFAPDGSFFFHSTDVSNSIFAFSDLFRLPPGQASESGFEPERTRLSEGFRAQEPDVSPDGKHVVFTTNHRGTRYLQVAELGSGETERLRNVHTPVPSQPSEQVFTPRFSPDGTHVAYSVWTKGSFRDIRYMDVRTGTYEEIAHDRAQDGDPSFTPDGRYILFHSDRTGINNIFAWEISSKKLFQVTNVLNGAFQPEVSPDGKDLLYVGYTKSGFDIFGMSLDPSTFTPAEPYVDTRPEVPKDPPSRNDPITPYQPLHTLVPRKYSVESSPGNFGQAFLLTVVGSDVAGLHTITGSLRAEVEQPSPQGSVSYSYGRLPFDVAASAYRTLTPRTGYAFGANKVSAVQETVGVTSAISYSRPKAFDGDTLAMSYSFGRIAADQPAPAKALDPYETPVIPFRGHTGSLQFSYSYSSAERYLYSVGAERGQSLGLSLSLTDPILASDFAGFVINADYTHYFRVPVPLKQHTFAIHGGAGASSGTFPGRSTFFVGGFVDVPPVDVLRNQIIQGGFVLRGYPTYAISGSNYLLANAEYRFPIVNIDRGLSTLPVFLNRITGDVFADYGTAFERPRDMEFKLGSGAELIFETQLGYFATFLFRAGAAHGFHSGADDRFYFVAAVPY